MLSTYEMALLHSTEAVLQVQWGLLVLDEAHKLKNVATQMYKAAIELRKKSQYCIGLTGGVATALNFCSCIFSNASHVLLIQALQCR